MVPSVWDMQSLTRQSRHKASEVETSQPLTCTGPSKTLKEFYVHDFECS